MMRKKTDTHPQVSRSPSGAQAGNNRKTSSQNQSNLSRAVTGLQSVLGNQALGRLLGIGSKPAGEIGAKLGAPVSGGAVAGDPKPC